MLCSYVYDIFPLQKHDGNGCKLINGYGKKPAATAVKNCSIEEEDSKILEPKEELQYLSEALGFQVTYTEFPQKTTSAGMRETKKSVPEFITLVKLSTKPPKVSFFVIIYTVRRKLRTYQFFVLLYLD